jgi:hypothetical protein
MQEKNHFPEPKQHKLTSDFNVQVHMLSTDGDALRTGSGYFCKLSYQCGPGIGSKV